MIENSGTGGSAVGMDHDPQGSPDRTERAGLRVMWVIASRKSGGIGPVCLYAAEAVARRDCFQCTILSLHDPHNDWIDEGSRVRHVSIGMPMNSPNEFMEWLRQNPQDIVITNDVSRIEPCFPVFPPGTVHVVQLHDSGRKYLNVAVQHQQVVDGVLCVAKNIESKLRSALEATGFQGLLGTVHNGADFPPEPARSTHEGPLRLLFMGSLDPLIKGIFDLVPILHHLDSMKVPVKLTIAGGRNEVLEARFKRRGLDHLVTWVGRVPHAECYRLAADHDVFLQTSRHESFGMVTIEAMCMGCVPVAYNIPSGNREIIEHQRCGVLVPLGDFNAWADSIGMLHQNRRRMLDLSHEAIRRSRTHFSSEKLADGLCEYLQAVWLRAKDRPSRRFPDQPVSPISDAQVKYSRLPPAFREWVRNVVGSSPRLSWWLLNR